MEHCSAVCCDGVQCGAVQMMLYGAVQCNGVQCGVVLLGAV